MDDEIASIELSNSSCRSAVTQADEGGQLSIRGPGAIIQ